MAMLAPTTLALPLPVLNTRTTLALNLTSVTLTNATTTPELASLPPSHVTTATTVLPTLALPPVDAYSLPFSSPTSA